MALLFRIFSPYKVNLADCFIYPLATVCLDSIATKYQYSQIPLIVRSFSVAQKCLTCIWVISRQIYSRLQMGCSDLAEILHTYFLG